MSTDYVITKNTPFKIFPKININKNLKEYLSYNFKNVNGLIDYCIFGLKLKGVFKPKIPTLCLVFNTKEDMNLANQSISKMLSLYFQNNPGFIDLMCFNIEDNEDIEFLKNIKDVCGFKKSKDW